MSEFDTGQLAVSGLILITVGWVIYKATTLVEAIWDWNQERRECEIRATRCAACDGSHEKT